MPAISIPPLPEPLTDLPIHEEASGVDTLLLFRSKGIYLGDTKSAEHILEAFGIVDQAATTLHHLGHLDDRAFGHVLQMLAGLSLAVSDAHYIANNARKR